MQLEPSREIGTNAFAYPFGYSKRMTDWGRYAKNPAFRHCLRNEMLAEVITEIWHLWPECHMVHGSPHHSESSGGVERVNCTVQAKLLGAWSVGCRSV